MAEGEINVEMRLKLQKLKQDAAQAGKDINAGLSQSLSEERTAPGFKGRTLRSPGTFQASSIKGLPKTDSENVETYRKAVTARTAAAARDANDRRDDIREATRRNRAQRLLRERSSNRADADIEQAARRNKARALLRERAEGRMDKERSRFEQNNPAAAPEESSGLTPGLLKLGPLAAVIIGAKIAFDALVAGIKKVISAISQAYDDARKLYGKSLSSGGLATSFVVNRQNLAKILGVSENDVFQFGAAVQKLQPQLEWSNKIFTETNRAVTGASWQMEILKIDLSALAMKVAADLVPAVVLFTKVLDLMVREIENHTGTLLGLAEITIFPMLSALLNMGGGKIISNIAKAASAGTDAPGVSAFMKQNPVSSWEKMGLVIGGGAQKDFARETARNTHDTVIALQKLGPQIAALVGQVSLGSMP